MTATVQTPTRSCAKCGVEKEIIHFSGRQRTCITCRTAQREKTLERKDAVAWTSELGERIADAIAAGSTIAEVCAQSAMPTPRQLRAWRRGNPDFDSAMEIAELQSAAVHLDAAKQVLKQVEEGKLPASDGRLLFDGHLKLAGVLNPKRYSGNATIDITSAGRPLFDLGSAIKALIDALPTSAGALPAPAPIDVEATEVPEGATLQ